MSTWFGKFRRDEGSVSRCARHEDVSMRRVWLRRLADVLEESRGRATQGSRGWSLISEQTTRTEIVMHSVHRTRLADLENGDPVAMSEMSVVNQLIPQDEIGDHISILSKDIPTIALCIESERFSSRISREDGFCAFAILSSWVLICTKDTLDSSIRHEECLQCIWTLGFKIRSKLLKTNMIMVLPFAKQMCTWCGLYIVDIHNVETNRTFEVFRWRLVEEMFGFNLQGLRLEKTCIHEYTHVCTPTMTQTSWRWAMAQTLNKRQWWKSLMLRVIDE